jgi:hypothetical protein
MLAKKGEGIHIALDFFFTVLFSFSCWRYLSSIIPGMGMGSIK